MHPSVERLYEAAKTVGVKAEPSAVATWLNESPQVVNNWKKRGVSRKGALDAQAKSGYSATWILDGTGERVAVGVRVEEPRNAYGLEPIFAWDHPDDLPPGEFVLVPRLDVHLLASNGQRQQIELKLTKESPEAFRADWIRKMRLKPNKLAAMRTSGDSMLPTIHDGDSVLVDTSQTQVVDGRVYALWYEGGERVKRLFILPGGGLRISSDNPVHQPIELEPQHVGNVRVLGLVVHRGGTGGLL